MSEASNRRTQALPLDPDLAQPDHGLPVHLRASTIALVLVGGTLGTAAREGLALAVPPVGGVPSTILVINVVGAFLLGLLLDALTRRGADRGRRRSWRLFAGTGFMGGFTTYSALAADTATLVDDGASGRGVGYALATVLIGAIATWCGIAAATAWHRRGHEGIRR